MTGINIPDMVAIVKRHGLIPIPVDLNIDTMAPLSVEEIESKITEKVTKIFKYSIDQSNGIRSFVWYYL